MNVCMNRAGKAIVSANSAQSGATRWKLVTKNKKAA